MVIMEKNKQTQGNNNRIWKLLCALFAVGAVLGLAVMCVQMYKRAQAEAELEWLAEQSSPDGGNETEKGSAGSPKDGAETENASGTNDAGKSTGMDETKNAGTDSLEMLKEMGVPIPEKEIDFTDLQENTNKDIYAWIYIPDSMIDYPVLQHDTDNTYYLNYNLDGSRGYPGCIYSENYNARDFSDPNTVLYGHNMKKGTMFAGLHKFEDSEYFEEHPYVYIYTPEKLLVYEIFAAYEHSNEHLLLNYDLSSEVIFQKYLDDIMDIRTMSSNIRKDMSLSSDNHILTLSTCIADKPDNRYLVQGVLLNED